MGRVVCRVASAWRLRPPCSVGPPPPDVLSLKSLPVMLRFRPHMPWPELDVTPGQAHATCSVQLPPQFSLTRGPGRGLLQQQPQRPRSRRGGSDDGHEADDEGGGGAALGGVKFRVCIDQVRGRGARADNGAVWWGARVQRRGRGGEGGDADPAWV